MRPHTPRTGSPTVRTAQTEVWQDSRTATVDGKETPIGRVNYLLRAIDIPAGDHTVDMVFDPKSLQTTDTAATVAIILIYILALGAIAIGIYRFAKPDKKEDAVQMD